MKLYQVLIITTYYGMFRIGEVTLSDHVVKARDVHIALNKPKLLFVLHSSKTHTKGIIHKSLKLRDPVLTQMMYFVLSAV